MRKTTFLFPMMALLGTFPAVAVASSPASDSALAEGDLGGAAVIDDAPYENLANPQAPVKSGWKLYTGYSGSDGVDADVSTGLWTSSVSKSWYVGSLTPNLKASWSTEDVAEAEASSGRLSAGLDWAPLEDGSFYLQGSWLTLKGQDDLTATAGTWWSLPLGEWFSLGLDGSGGWSRVTEGDGHVGADLSLETDRISLCAGGAWDYRKVDFVAVTGVSNADYQNVWSSSADARFTWGTWSTGPSWSLEYWKASALASQTTTRIRNSSSGSSNGNGNGSQIVRSRTVVVRADGTSLTQEASWNLSWKPLRGWSLDLAGFRTFGQTTLKVKAPGSSTKNQKQFTPSTQTEFTPPPESWGGSASLSIGW